MVLTINDPDDQIKTLTDACDWVYEQLDADVAEGEEGPFSCVNVPVEIYTTADEAAVDEAKGIEAFEQEAELIEDAGDDDDDGENEIIVGIAEIEQADEEDEVDEDPAIGDDSDDNLL